MKIKEILEKRKIKKELKDLNFMIALSTPTAEGEMAYNYYCQRNDEGHYMLESAEENLERGYESVKDYVSKEMYDKIIISFLGHIVNRTPVSEEEYMEMRPVLQHKILIKVEK